MAINHGRWSIGAWAPSFKASAQALVVQYAECLLPSTLYTHLYVAPHEDQGCGTLLPP
jgi:hypothetical protein